MSDLDKPEVPALDGVHHVKLPVSDLDRARDWYGTRLGYQVERQFEEAGAPVGLILTHPRGGPMLGLRRNPEQAARSAGFAYFAIGVGSKSDLQGLAARLTAFGDDHAGVHPATFGWVLPLVHDPDGHELQFYATGE
ncbi:MAG: VOC family protein [Kribbellaceae bacterium]|nr:VOC family protein [Kribbellaceae bacterium]